jgi:subtilisin-like proprotein convertase family protein
MSVDETILAQNLTHLRLADRKSIAFIGSKAMANEQNGEKSAGSWELT